MKLAVFDFDSTLMDGETLDIIARETNFAKEIAEITAKGMRGEIDFFESLEMRVALLKGVKLETVNEICNNLPIMNGAKETIQELHKKGYKCVCFSGGFKNATVLFADKLNLDGEFANIFHTKNNILTGKVGGEMMFSNSKGDMLVRLQKLLNVSYDDTLAVGDGANDLSMFKYAKKKAAFCAKEVLKKEANIVIEKKDLTLILDKV
ncbi:phosphoserine phosphatase SerB [Brachyspira pilosicoli]|uniref:Phosphoserine phosphatase n=2 Tax=Brachyspira pilosicoli TaxID=52584 RepID=A0A3B6VI44_BRAPL|nr:phosphoserine phosphatase SerB [Brachyspira pilosicoli]AGA65590.1 phosphoserine phosphatase SerB [Brachyspira pilosicoli P43/6/78]PLV63054.1 phosphoserine phosphatase [Brachyspira pilosicoli SP16]WIH82175.1 phosphoserine phosphatase SerB [Brachyspira pilosicoli]WIH83806.1 phosphoserine phosphatase SerB [Brachyspira pilosicoli]WIH86663.1 phosphoserine phosphatase SerB [Brachyspira pilosicoli]